MKPGNLDRRIDIQALTETRGAAGGIVATWATLKTVWAEKLPSSGNEFRAAQSRHAETSQVFRIRYYSGLSETTHRISYSDRVYDILHIAEEGRREGMLISCKYTEGAAT